MFLNNNDYPSFMVKDQKLENYLPCEIKNIHNEYLCCLCYFEFTLINNMEPNCL